MPHGLTLSSPPARPKMLPSGRMMFSSGVSTAVTGTGLPSTVTVGASGSRCSGRGHTPVIRLQFAPKNGGRLERAALD